MVEIVKTKKKYLGNVIIPIGTKLVIEDNKVIFECSSFIRDRINDWIDNRIDSLISKYTNSKFIKEHESTEEDYELWGIYVMEEERIPIKNFADGLNELLKEFPPSEDITF